MQHNLYNLSPRTGEPVEVGYNEYAGMVDVKITRQPERLIATHFYGRADTLFLTFVYRRENDALAGLDRMVPTSTRAQALRAHDAACARPTLAGL